MIQEKYPPCACSEYDLFISKSQDLNDETTNDFVVFRIGNLVQTFNKYKEEFIFMIH